MLGELRKIKENKKRKRRQEGTIHQDDLKEVSNSRHRFGGSSSIFFAKYLQHVDVTVKEVLIPSDEATRLILREARILRRLRHNNIIKVYGTSYFINDRDVSYAQLIMEYTLADPSMIILIMATMLILIRWAGKLQMLFTLLMNTAPFTQISKQPIFSSTAKETRSSLTLGLHSFCILLKQ